MPCKVKHPRPAREARINFESHPRQHIPPLKPLLQQGRCGGDGAVGEVQVLVQKLFGGAEQAAVDFLAQGAGGVAGPGGG